MSPYFEWTHKHKFTSIGRSYFDARYGRVALALTRLADLAKIFPEDSELALAEGFVRLEYLGEGLLARELFEKAHQLKEDSAAAAKNASLVARSAEEFSHWVEIALPLNPDDRDFLFKIELIKKSLSEGLSFWQVLLHRTAAAEEKKNYGTAASLAELLLLHTDEMGSDSELSVRKTRAKCLRELDKDVTNKRQALNEYLPPQERLSIGNALDEIEKIIMMDEFDPEMWNFKSAWCSLLHRFDEADACADRALELRPHGYPKPLLNKCDVRLKQKKYDEALVLAKKALAIAQSSSYKSDIPIAQGVIKRATCPPRPHTEQSLPGYSLEFIKTAAEVSEQEIAGKGSIDKLANGVMLRLMNSIDSQNTTSVMAELTADFTPETVWRTLHVVLKNDADLFEAGLTGMLYAAMQPQEALRRDAARLLSLTILSSGTTDAIRDCYRRLVLTPAQSDSTLYSLLSMVEKELKRMDPTISALIINQPLPTSAEIQQFKSPLGKFGDLGCFFKKYSRQRLISNNAIKSKKNINAIKFLGTIGSFIGAISVFRWAYGGWPPMEGDLWTWLKNDPQAKTALAFSLVGVVVGGFSGKVFGITIKHISAFKNENRK